MNYGGEAHNYSGIFKDDDLDGVLRLSIGNKPQQFADGSKINYSPSFGLKFFRDNSPSCDILTLKSFQGQSHANFWKGSLSTVVSGVPKLPKLKETPTTPRNVINLQRWLEIVSDSIKLTQRRTPVPQSAGHTVLYECGLRDAEGTVTSPPVFPFSLRFEANPILGLYCEYVYLTHGQDSYDEYDMLSQAFDKYSETSADYDYTRNPFECLKLERDYTRFIRLLFEQLNSFDNRFNQNADTITKAKNLIYKVKAHETPFREGETNDCGKCLRYVELAYNSTFEQNAFFDDNLRFTHDMPRKYMGGRSYKDANGVQQMYYKKNDTDSETRWKNFKGWWSNEDHFFTQDTEKWDGVCSWSATNTDAESVSAESSMTEKANRFANELLGWLKCGDNDVALPPVSKRMF